MTFAYSVTYLVRYNVNGKYIMKRMLAQKQKRLSQRERQRRKGVIIINLSYQTLAILAR